MKAPELGQTFTFLGYGLQGQFGAQIVSSSTEFGTLFSGENEFDKVATSAEGFDGKDAAGNPATTALAFDFDSGNAAYNQFGDTGLGAIEADTAHGDSGGPSFLPSPSDPATLEIAGITSFGRDDPSAFGDVSIDTRVSSFAGTPWLVSTLSDLPKYDMVLDMSRFLPIAAGAAPLGADGVPDTITADRNGDNLELFVDGRLFFSDSVSHIATLTIGSPPGNTSQAHDQTTITVASDLGVPVNIFGRYSVQQFSDVDHTPLQAGAIPDPRPIDKTSNDPIGPITYNGGVTYTAFPVPEDALIVQCESPAEPLTVSSQAVSIGTETIQYNGLKSVLTTAPGNELVELNLPWGPVKNVTYNVGSTPSGGLTINDSGIGDAINVGDANTTLDGIGSLRINGGAGTTLNFDDEATQATTAPDAFEYGKGAIETFTPSPQYQISDQQIIRTNQVTDTVTQNGNILYQSSATYHDLINYANITSVTIQGGGSGNAFNVSSTGTPITIVAGNGNDTVNVGDPDGLLQAIGKLTVKGGAGTILTLDDQFNTNISPAKAAEFNTWPTTTSPVYQITDQSVVRTDTVTQTDPATGDQTSTPYTATIAYSNIPVLVINGGISADAFKIDSTAAGTAMTINGGPGADSYSVALGNLDGPITIVDSGPNTSANNLVVTGTPAITTS